MKLIEKQGQLRKFYTDADAILKNESATKEELATADGFINQAIQLQAEIDSELARAKSMADLNQYLTQGAGRQSIPDNSKDEETKNPSGFKSFGEFLVSARFGRDPRLVYDAMYFRGDQRDLAYKDLAEAGGAAAGITVPHEFRPQLLEAAAEQAIIRPRATVIPMATRSISLPVLDQTGVIAAGSGYSAMYAGVYVEWTEEAGDFKQHEPTFNEIELVVHKLTGYMRASDELLADNALSLEAILTRLMGGAIAWAEDYAFLRGDGAGKPQGILNSPATLGVTRTAAGAAFEYPDAVNMLAKLMPGASGLWICNQQILPDIVNLKDTIGNLLWHADAGVGLRGTLFGLPVVFTEKLPAAGTAGDVLLVDPSYYLIGDRQAITIASSDQERFRQGQVSWRCVSRVDGQGWLQDHIHLADGSGEMSPFVKLV